MSTKQTPELFDTIAGQYDLVSAWLSLGGFHGWHRHARRLLAVAPGQAVLDVGCGTGSVTRRLARDAGAGGLVVGLDPSPGMLAAARARPDPRRGASLQWVQGYGESLPFDDARFDRVSALFSLRNMVDWRAAVREMARVLRPQGRLVILELVQPITPRGLRALKALEWATRRLIPSSWPAYRWLGRSLLHAPTQAELVEQLRWCGLKPVATRHWLGDLVCLVAAEPLPAEELPRRPSPEPVVVWATDGSETAAAAGRWIVANVARGATVHVVAVRPPTADEPPDIAETDRLAWQRDLDRAVGLLPATQFRIVAHLMQGNPAECLLRVAETVQPRALILGEKGKSKGGGRPAGLGVELLQRSRWPLVLVPFHGSEEAPPSDAGCSSS